MDHCEYFNAQLPLPKSKEEAIEFRKVIGTKNTWIGIRDLKKNGVKACWKDKEGNPVGNSYVNLRVIKIVLLFFS